MGTESEEAPDMIGLADSRGQRVGIKRLTHEIAQHSSQPRQLFAHAFDLNLRRFQAAGKRARRFPRFGVAAARHFPPHNRETQLLQPLGDGREIIANRPGAANEKVGPGKVNLLLLKNSFEGRAENPTSNIQHPTSNIQHPTSNIQHPSYGTP